MVLHRTRTTVAILMVGCLAMAAGCTTTSANTAADDPATVKAADQPAPGAADGPAAKKDGDEVSSLWDGASFDPQKLRSLSLAGRVRPINRPTYYLALRAFLFGFPVVNNYLKTNEAYEKLKEEDKEELTRRMDEAFNKLGHANRLASPKETMVPSPNNDTMYSGATLDLRTEPVVLSVPAIKDRYYSFQLMDAYTSTFDYVGSRKTGTGPGSYVIAGPGWNGKLARPLPIIRAPTPYVWLLARTLLHGASDMKNVEAIQKQYKLQPLSLFEGRPRLTPQKQTFDPPAPKDDPLGFYKTMAVALKLDPPLPRDQPLVRKFRRIGFQPDWSFDESRLRPGQQQAMALAVEDGRKLLETLTSNSGKTEDGWNRPVPGMGSYGVKYIVRAAVALKGLGACTAEEASYRTANLDAEDRPMTGAHSYVLRFTTAPPARSFWSITMYDFKTHLLVDNPIKRYSIGDRTAGLVRGKDGAVEIHIQQTKPKGKGANWLPAPTGRFYVVLRLYVPTADYLAGKYKIPGIRRLPAK